MALITITRDSGIPLVGCVYFGIIDRGTSLLQVRASCSCNLSCPFCSVDAGPESQTRTTQYLVDLGYLAEHVDDIAAFKGPGVECHIDSPGEPMMYPEIAGLVKSLKEIPEVDIVSMQTNGTLLTDETIAAFEKAGLDRINLSLHALDPALARMLAGVPWYDINRVCGMARRVAESGIDLLIAPVFIPGINDTEIPGLIRFAKEIGAGKRWPLLGIQKFERYRFGRCPAGVKAQTWWQFYHRSIPQWEKETGVPLVLKPSDFGTERRKMLPIVFAKGEREQVELRLPGWISGEILGVARGRVISVMHSPKEKGHLRVKIVSTKHNIYVGVPV
jgi:uncharacterized Fe-S cluster-containing radical SAM superfamily enzyme